MIEVKIITFILEHGPGIEEEGIFSRSEAEWEISKHLNDGWTFMGAGGANGAHDLSAIGIGYVLLQRITVTD
jgi:hypothetical protein